VPWLPAEWLFNGLLNKPNKNGWQLLPYWKKVVVPCFTADSWHSNQGMKMDYEKILMTMASSPWWNLNREPTKYSSDASELLHLAVVLGKAIYIAFNFVLSQKYSIFLFICLHKFSNLTTTFCNYFEQSSCLSIRYHYLPRRNDAYTHQSADKYNVGMDATAVLLSPQEQAIWAHLEPI
jgi:hypothetical protein